MERDCIGCIHQLYYPFFFTLYETMVGEDKSQMGRPIMLTDKG